MGNIKPFLSIFIWVYSVTLFAQIKPDFVTAPIWKTLPIRFLWCIMKYPFRVKCLKWLIWM